MSDVAAIALFFCFLVLLLICDPFAVKARLRRLEQVVEMMQKENTNG